MEIGVINNYSDFKKLKNNWNILLDKCENKHIHSTYEWADTWWRHFGEGNKLFILAAFDEEEMIGIAPFIIKSIGKFYNNTFKVKSLSFLADGFSDKADFIIPNNRKDVVNAFCEFIFKNKNEWDEISLKQIDLDSPNYLNFINYFRLHSDFNFITEKLTGCPYLNLSGNFNDYYSKLDGRFKKEIRRRLKKLQSERDINFQVESIISDKLLQEIYQLNFERQKKINKRSIFLHDIKWNFIQDIIKILNDKKNFKVFLLRDGEKLFTYSISFDFNKTINLWNTCYDVDYKNFSPGNLLIKHILEYCFENNYKACNFGPGEEEYKLSWTQSLLTNQIIIITKKNIKSVLINLYPKLRNSVKSKIKAYSL
jgi:hypothetical protein